jgi:hypothetical protein
MRRVRAPRPPVRRRIGQFRGETGVPPAPGASHQASAVQRTPGPGRSLPSAEHPDDGAADINRPIRAAMMDCGPVEEEQHE